MLQKDRISAVVSGHISKRTGPDPKLDFTIVTPSFNYGNFIGECLSSVAGQSGVRLEHLIIDGCSTDDTAEIVRRFSHATLLQEPDNGMTEAINKGFRMARGAWVMWLNADDRLLPDALHSVLEFVQTRDSVDVVFGCWNFVNEDGEFLRRMTLFPFLRGMIANYGCFLGSTATFFRVDTTVGEGIFLNENFRYVMDGEYFARLSAMGKRFAYLPRVIADFRLHGASISQRNLERRDIDGVLAYQKQVAESRAIMRIYGIRLSNDEMLNGVVEGVVFQWYRIIKGLLRALYRHRCVE